MQNPEDMAGPELVQAEVAEGFVPSFVMSFLADDGVGVFAGSGQRRQIGFVQVVREQGRAAELAQIVVLAFDQELPKFGLGFGGCAGREPGEEFTIALSTSANQVLAIVRPLLVRVTP